MTAQKKNPLLDRLMTALGAPQNVPDAAAFLNEFRRQTDAFGPNVLEKAADYLIRDLGRYWPTFKQVLAACEDARSALTTNATPEPGANARMPWEIRDREAKAWAADYIRTSVLGQQAMAEGWRRWLELYAWSYAKNCPPGFKLMPNWRPPADIIATYRGYAGIRKSAA